MKQVLIIHGGNSFSSYESYRKYLDEKAIDYDKLINPRRWKENLADGLPDFDVLYPSMPNGLNAVYDEWVIYFDKLIKFFEDDVQIIGHSLGAMFLAKYLHEHTLERPIHRLILVSGGYDDDTNEDLGSFKVNSARGLEQSANEIHLFHSQDDPVVPFTELAKFQADLPGATSHIFTGRGHFLQPEFPELLELLQKIK